VNKQSNLCTVPKRPWEADSEICSGVRSLKQLKQSLLLLSYPPIEDAAFDILFHSTYCRRLVVKYL
jgi:hypothetical protein